MRYLQLRPPGGETEIAPLLERMFAAIEPPDDRPYTLVNFIESVDGRATVKGRSGGLGDDGDRTLFHSLRERVDAVYAGTTTMRLERYGRILGKPERRQRRRERGLSPEPIACTMTRSGEVPTEIPLFSEPEVRVIVFGPASLEGCFDDCAASVELVVLQPGELTFAAAMARLRERGVRTLLCEGGPRVFGGLLREGVADELFLTLAPKLTGGGDGPAITSGPELVDPAELELRWLLERDGALYARYLIRR